MVKLNNLFLHWCSSFWKETSVMVGVILKLKIQFHFSLLSTYTHGSMALWMVILISRSLGRPPFWSRLIQYLNNCWSLKITFMNHSCDFERSVLTAVGLIPKSKAQTQTHSAAAMAVDSLSCYYPTDRLSLLLTLSFNTTPCIYKEVNPTWTRWTMWIMQHWAPRTYQGQYRDIYNWSLAKRKKKCKMGLT